MLHQIYKTNPLGNEVIEDSHVLGQIYPRYYSVGFGVRYLVPLWEWDLKKNRKEFTRFLNRCLKGAHFMY